MVSLCDFFQILAGKFNIKFTRGERGSEISSGDENYILVKQVFNLFSDLKCTQPEKPFWKSFMEQMVDVEWSKGSLRCLPGIPPVYSCLITRSS